MGKKKKDNKIDSKLVRSINKNVRSSTRKLKPILKSIVGKKVGVAIRDLTFSEKRISKDVKKTISSAIVIICEGRTFIAGADISEFGKEPKGPSLFEVQDIMENFNREKR